MSDTKINLLDYFTLRHTQLSHLEVALKEVIEPDVKVQAKVELNLTPREMKVPPADGTPAFQVTARLTCHGLSENQGQNAMHTSEQTTENSEPLFKVVMVVHAAYRQHAGEPVNFELFAQNHTSLVRQIYPLVHQQVKPVLQQLGLANINLPYDLVDQKPVAASNTVSSVLH